MAGTLRFTWDTRGPVDHARAASHRALGRLQIDAHAAWDATAPVGTDTRQPKKGTTNPEGHKPGELRDSWFAYVKDDAGTVWLIIGAGARYAIFVELGTGRMAPRAPLRTVAGMMWPQLEQYLVEEMSR